MKNDPNDDIRYDEGKSLSSALVSLVGLLTVVLNSIKKTNSPFLIFAPTYRHLDQVHYELSKLECIHQL